MLKKSSFSVVIPCYNEEDSIPTFASEMSGFYKNFANTYPDTELNFLFVENNSNDNSLQLLKNIEEKFNYVRVLQFSVQGYGAALKHGFQKSDADYLAMLDLDNTYPLESLITMYQMIRDENYDIVFGARIHTESKISLVRFVGNKIYAIILKYLMRSSLSDVCSGMRVFKSKIKPELLKLTTNDLSFSIDFTSMLMIKKYIVAELPIKYRKRTGFSKLSLFKDGVLFLYIVLKKSITKRA